MKLGVILDRCVQKCSQDVRFALVFVLEQEAERAGVPDDSVGNSVEGESIGVGVVDDIQGGLQLDIGKGEEEL